MQSPILVYSTAKYCVRVWCRSAHTRLIESALSDAQRIVTGCLHPIPTEYLPILSDIQPAELRCQGATLSIANRGCLDLDQFLHGQLRDENSKKNCFFFEQRWFSKTFIKILFF